MSPGLKERMKEIHSTAVHAIVPPSWAAGLRSKSARCEVCSRSLTLRHFSDHKAGIRMGERWYCSSACFSSAAEEQFYEQLRSRLVQSQHVSRMPLALILISRGWLTNQQSQDAIQAIKEQKDAGGEIEELGDLLVRLRYVSEKQVTAARAAQWGCPVFAVQNREIRARIHLPPTLVKLYSMLPLHYVAATRRLLVGFVHGVEYGLLYTVEQMTGCKTEPCFVTPSDFQFQMQQREQMAEQSPAMNEIKFDRFRTPSEMAAILCSHAVHLEADEAFIGKSRDYLWARLGGGPDAVDFLFRAG